MKLTYGHIYSPTFLKELTGLKLIAFPVKVSHKIFQVSQFIMKMREMTQQEFDTLRNELFQKNEDGSWRVDENDRFVPLQGISLDEATQRIKDFMAKEFQVPVNPIQLHEIKDMKISAQVLDVLGPIFS